MEEPFLMAYYNAFHACFMARILQTVLLRQSHTIAKAISAN